MGRRVKEPLFTKEGNPLLFPLPYGGEDEGEGDYK
jgi:hypothetical protein